MLLDRKVVQQIFLNTLVLSVTIKSFNMCCRTWYVPPYITCVNVRDICYRTWYFLQYTIAQFLQYRIPKSKYLCWRNRHIMIYLNTKNNINCSVVEYVLFGSMKYGLMRMILHLIIVTILIIMIMMLIIVMILTIIIMMLIIVTTAQRHR